MTDQKNRREFLQRSAAYGVGLLGASRLPAATRTSAAYKTALIGRPDRKTLEAFKAGGFDGIEARTWDASPQDAREQRKLADQLGMRIHSVLRGWTNFNSGDAQQVAEDIASVERALRTCEIYGADALLLVPCRRLAKVAVPKPEEFQIDFDRATGHVTRVVAGDNAPFQGYIQAQNEAIDASRRALDKLIPVAEKTGVMIALENVWSDFWVKPNLFAHFVQQFQSPWVQTYFDIGNHVKYAPPEQWIDALSDTIVKVHVKDFVIQRDAPRGGKFVDIREGDVNWPSVMKALARVGYQGWFTIEGSGGLSIDEQHKRLDLILAGK